MRVSFSLHWAIAFGLVGGIAAAQEGVLVYPWPAATEPRTSEMAPSAPRSGTGAQDSAGEQVTAKSSSVASQSVAAFPLLPPELESGSWSPKPNALVTVLDIVDPWAPPSSAVTAPQSDNSVTAPEKSLVLAELPMIVNPW